MKLLLVEDDAETADYVRRGLCELGHGCDVAPNGVEGLTAALTRDYDAIILDRNLPQLDGLAVLQALRAQHNRTPVLLLSALSDVAERVIGLRAGGDDYLAKPFSFQELVARLEAIVRRKHDPVEERAEIVVGDLRVDLRARRGRRGNRAFDLLNKEFQLLDYLMRHAGQVITRTMLTEAIWDYDFNPGTNVIDVHISRLRAKIDGPGETPMIQTVRGAGYRLDVG